MIEDFDGPDPAPSRRGHVLAVSVFLLLAVVAGYVAVTSPELRGPYATPRPGVVAPQATPATQAFRSAFVPNTQLAIPLAGCYKIALPRQQTVFVGGRVVTLQRAAADPPRGVDTIIAVTANGTGLMWNACAPSLWQTDAEPFAR